MATSKHDQQVLSWDHLPEEIWIDILNKLRLTDLALISQACKLFSDLTRQSIHRYARHESPFSAYHEFSQNGVPIEPDIHPETGLAICFDEVTSTLKILNLSSGSLIASCPENSCFPVSLKFSKTGSFAAVCFDTKIRFYILDSVAQKLIPCREVKFDVRIRDFVPPGYGRCRYGMGRMLASFSGNDKKIAVAHIFESLGAVRFVTFKCLTANLLNDDVEGDSCMDYERFRGSTNVQKTATVRIKVDKEFVSFWDIQMNAEPLRFLIPPGCIHKYGFLLDPSKPHSISSLRIHDSDSKLGSLVTFCFSACGRYYFEARHKSHEMIYTVTISKFDLETGLLTSTTNVPIMDLNMILHVLISNDSNLAVILLGTLTGDTSEIAAWYVTNLCGEGYLHVERKKPIYTSKYERYDRTFGLSDDGQLLSVSCDPNGSVRYCMIKVFETATGRDVSTLTCSTPEGGDVLQADWQNVGRCARYHVFGGRRRPTLTVFTTSDSGVTFSHAS